MLSKSLLLVASAALAIASPIKSTGGCSSPKAKPVLPVNGGGTELPSPPSNVSLKYIGLGLGIQNYTCASEGATAASTGALAMLYDITSLYPGSRAGSLSQAEWTALTGKAVTTHATPLNLSPSTTGRIAAADEGASLTNPFPADSALHLSGMAPIPFLGHHFFDSTGVPNFVLHDGAQELVAAKLDSIAAPSTANPGPDGTGAVAWLLLDDNGTGASKGLTYVYRVLTAGGNAHTCSGAGADSTTYSAMYWFYA